MIGEEATGEPVTPGAATPEAATPEAPKEGPGGEATPEAASVEKPSPEALAIRYLRSPGAVRERCRAVLDYVLAGRSQHFRVDLGQLGTALRLTREAIASTHPDVRTIPMHSRVNHFGVGGRDRLGELEGHLGSARERARALTDLIVTSVLLDAGAGPDWRFVEPGTNIEARRSEGLALASFHCFASGVFSSDPARPHQADAEGLSRVTGQALAMAFQVRPDNLLVGLEGRAALLRELGRAIKREPASFAFADCVGGLCDALANRSERGRLPAEQLLPHVLEALGSIWPPRTQRFGVELGDVWPHPGAGGEGETRGLVPLHKLSQWLCYSLIYPLAAAGIEVVDVDALSGLAEYRNGGLFIDTAVIVPTDPAVLERSHAASSELVVEWRALTVALLDRLAAELRAEFGLDARSLPLGKVLEGGTWAAGRKLAAERRNGAPPFAVQSDGTLF
jgi:hypothetical protein